MIACRKNALLGQCASHDVSGSCNYSLATMSNKLHSLGLLLGAWFKQEEDRTEEMKKGKGAMLYSNRWNYTRSESWPIRITNRKNVSRGVDCLLKSYSSNLVLHLSEVEELARDRFLKRTVNIDAAKYHLVQRMGQAPKPPPVYYNSHNASLNSFVRPSLPTSFKPLTMVRNTGFVLLSCSQQQTTQEIRRGMTSGLFSQTRESLL